MVVTALAKFSDGAWIVVVLGGALIAGFVSINRHYREVAGQLSLDGYDGPPPMQHTVLVLVGDLHKGVVQALQYARTLSPSAKAVYVEMDPEKTRRLEEKWGKWGFGVPLVVLTSPYRLLLTPAARLRGPSPRARREPHGDHRHPRVHPGEVVAAAPPQPDRAGHQGGAALPPERGRHRRPVSPAEVVNGNEPGGLAEGRPDEYSWAEMSSFPTLQAPLVTIRSATAADHDALQALEGVAPDSGASLIQARRNFFSRMAAYDRTRVLVAEQEHRVVGVQCLALTPGARGGSALLGRLLVQYPRRARATRPGAWAPGS